MYIVDVSNVYTSTPRNTTRFVRSLVHYYRQKPRSHKARNAASPPRRARPRTHSLSLARRTYIIQNRASSAAPTHRASTDDAPFTASLVEPPHSRIRFARARLPPARVLGVVNKPKIGDVASRRPTGARVTDSSPPLARRDARCRPSAVTSSHTLCSPSSAVARGTDASRSRRRGGDDASGVTRSRDWRDGANLE